MVFIMFYTKMSSLCFILCCLPCSVHCFLCICATDFPHACFPYAMSIIVISLLLYFLSLFFPWGFPGAVWVMNHNDIAGNFLRQKALAQEFSRACSQRQRRRLCHTAHQDTAGRLSRRSQRVSRTAKVCCRQTFRDWGNSCDSLRLSV